MAEYKKKRVNKLRGAPKPRKTKAVYEEQDDILMTPSVKKKRKASAQKPSGDNMRVVKGNKLERRRKTKVFLIFVASLTVICLIINFILPAGIFESIQNLTSIIGTGSYPVTLQSSEVLSSESKGGYYYVLTDTRINAYASGGKEIFSESHGFENPVMKTSKTRAIVFSQGAGDALIYNLAELKGTVKQKEEIITANISDSGAYAIVSKSPSYASAVKVYNKYNKLVYEWYSSEDTVNNVAVSPNGKKIAVSSFNAASGAYNSKLSVLSFDSATPEFTESYNNALIYDINTSGGGTFSVISGGNVQHIKWSNFKKTEYKNDYNIALFRAGTAGTAAVFNRSSDKTDNRIAVFSKSGKLKGEFAFKGIINDIEFSKGHIYCISDTNVYILSLNGEVLRTAVCGFGAVNLSVTGTNNVAVITDNLIEEIKLEEK